mmetsp:Transcript_7817/g.23145  ORF Transcript_7817/g.23145 Transcript_7817/m.23145 type:complete len:201 (-) Transcript_7817:79-681(-)
MTPLFRSSTAWKTAVCEPLRRSAWMPTMARSSAKLYRPLWSSPSKWSKTLAMGHAMGVKRNCTTATMGANFAAIFSCSLPVNTAEGMISPNMSTSVTDKITAIQEGTILSKNKGKASFAHELSNSNVTRSLWWSLMSGRTLWAAAWSSFNLCLSLSATMSLSSVLTMMCISIGSMDTRPMVKPAASAATVTQINAKTACL